MRVFAILVLAAALAGCSGEDKAASQQEKGAAGGAEKAGPVAAVTDQNFDQEVLQADKLVLVDFWAVWCGPCKIIKPHLEALATEYTGQIKVVALDTDKNPAISKKYGIQFLPTVLFFKNGEIVDKFVGVKSKEQIESMIKNHLAAS